MNLCCIQSNILWEDKLANQRHVAELVAQARPAPRSLLVLPEMFSTGFSMNVAGIREGSPSENEAFLKELAQRHNIAVLGGLVSVNSAGRGLNQAVAFGPDGSLLCRYTKMHPFSFSDENLHFAPGDKLQIFEWEGFKIAPLICYDLRFPELFRRGVDQGAELFAVIANWPSKRVAHWTTLLQARAIENLAYVVGVNRVGEDPKCHYPGRSLVVDPWGSLAADGGDSEQCFQVAVDPTLVRQWRKDFPALADRRRDL